MTYYPPLAQFRRVPYIRYTCKPSWPHLDVTIYETARHKPRQLLELQFAGRQHSPQFPGLDKIMIVVNASYQATVGKVLTVPDHDRSCDQCAIDRIEDKDAPRSKHTRNLPNRSFQVPYMLQHI